MSGKQVLRRGEIVDIQLIPGDETSWDNGWTVNTVSELEDGEVLFDCIKWKGNKPIARKYNIPYDDEVRIAAFMEKTL